MQSSRRLLLAALPLLAIAVLSACHPAASGRKKVAFISNCVDAFWTIADAGVQDAAKKFDVEAQTLMPVEGNADQKRMIEDLLTRGIDGISVSPIDPANQTDFFNTAAKRTKLITNDSDAPASERLLYIGLDNYQAGRLCGALVREAMPQGGSVMLFIGRLEQDNSKRRRQGTIDAILGRPDNADHFDPPSEVLEGGGFKILGTLTDQADRSKGKANVEDTLAKFPDIGGLVGLFAYNAPLILEALRQAGKLGQIKVVAFDEDKATLAGIEQGFIHGTIVQNPYQYGFKSVEVLAALARGDRSVIPASKFIDIPARQIRRGNVAEFKADLQAKTGTGK